MGHTIGIHRQCYRLPDDVYQTSQIAKMLLLMEKGELTDVKGKTLKEIEINMDEDLLETREADETIENEIPLEIEDRDETAQSDGKECSQPSSLRCVKTIPKKHNEPLKKSRNFVKWTEEQKQRATEFFKSHIENSVPPKKHECDEFMKKYKNLFKNKLG
ncbi:hypothetical protein WA026_012570 [Henosepilachna vigintioctopunctata]|uniref:Uncharacterized protein n=1 Tax=Henosepilachna vigintioctopunctata TaxID=420089 RepID=A0AAW1U8M6_9CUCU